MEKKVRSYPDERWGKVTYHLETAGKDYYFSDYGRLKSVDKESGTEKLLKGSKLKTGFLLIRVFFKGGKSKSFYVHKLIAQEWIEKDHEDQTFVVHLDRNVENNYYQNLKWMTQEELTEVFKENGVFDPQKRKRNSHYKMNPAKVQLLRKRLKEGKTRKKIIAKEFGITLDHLKEIEKGNMWGWVKSLEESNV